MQKNTSTYDEKQKLVDDCIEKFNAEADRVCFPEKVTPTLIEKLVEEFEEKFRGSRLDKPMPTGIETMSNIKDFLRTSLLTIQKAERDAVREWAKEQLKLDKEAVPVGAYEQAWEDGLQSALFALDIRLRHLDEQDKTNER